LSCDQILNRIPILVSAMVQGKKKNKLQKGEEREMKHRKKKKKIKTYYYSICESQIMTVFI